LFNANNKVIEKSKKLLDPRKAVQIASTIKRNITERREAQLDNKAKSNYVREQKKKI
jgi:hypothetical protein